MVRWLAVAFTLLVTSCGSSSGDAAVPPYCDELRELRQYQRRYTQDYLIALTQAELAANFEEQHRHSDKVRLALPQDLAARWQLHGEVFSIVEARLLARWPDDDENGSELLAEAREAGFNSLTEFVWQEPVALGEREWTFEDWNVLGESLDEEVDSACSRATAG